MKGTKDNKFTNTVVLLRVDISEKEKIYAKKMAKSKGYSFQGWLGSLVKEELKKDTTNQNDQIP